MDPNKIKIYESLFKMGAQLILIIVAVVAFFIVLNYFLYHANDQTSKWISGAIDTALGATIYKLYDFYFPTKKSRARR